MKIRIITPQRVVVPAGTIIDVDDSRAALFMQIGAAEIAEPEMPVETADVTPRRKKKV